jgi:hypothetical protein
MFTRCPAGFTPFCTFSNQNWRLFQVCPFDLRTFASSRLQFARLAMRSTPRFEPHGMVLKEVFYQALYHPFTAIDLPLFGRFLPSSEGVTPQWITVMKALPAIDPLGPAGRDASDEEPRPVFVKLGDAFATINPFNGRGELERTIRLFAFFLGQEKRPPGDDRPRLTLLSKRGEIDDDHWSTLLQRVVTCCSLWSLKQFFPLNLT